MTESKGVAVLFYILLLTVAIGFILAPLAIFIVWRLRRDEPFVDFHGRQSLDLAITVALAAGGTFLAGRLVAQAWVAVGAVLQWLAIGIVVLQAALTLWGLAIAAQGQQRSLPLSLTWLRRQQPKAEGPGGEADAQ